jgi:hypothetical protein
MKDVGGIVKDYQAQTALYRATDREVRIHECHSACTLALSLPNVCVYPDSIFKFHQAYSLRTKVTDLGVSAEMFASYPAAVQARLGTLTRDFKILKGSELIMLGIRDCTKPREDFMVTAKEPSPTEDAAITNVWSNVMSAFGTRPMAVGVPARATRLVATRQQTEKERQLPEDALLANAPLPPPRPDSIKESETEVASLGDSVPPPPQRPSSVAVAFTQSLAQSDWPKMMEGAQPILPPRFQAYAIIARLGR